MLVCEHTTFSPNLSSSDVGISTVLGTVSEDMGSSLSLSLSLSSDDSDILEKRGFLEASFSIVFQASSRSLSTLASLRERN